MFNISDYARLLTSDFLAAGGKFEIREFNSPQELLNLPEHTFINATGYGAKALFNDDSIIPVRGQTARLTPQPGVTYALVTRDLLMLPRTDGLLIEMQGDIGNFDNDNVTPDRYASEAAVTQLAKLVSDMKRS